MSYEPLHHKYRPQKFAQLVGQEAIATTLTNALETGRIAPAYLFTGPRGTGKTSSARILAKSLNCLTTEQPTPNPCGECEVCTTIAKGSALDVIEIDAASNTGVDNIREIIERAQFAPVQCRYKLYIIDEAHMLSVAAFNALLKTLEEPPSRVVFVLATTDPQRILPTIISRCQRFDFRRIPLAAMVEHLHYIASHEGIEITDEAVTLIAQIANGGLRDAESLLDQLSLLPTKITVESVWDLVGAVPEQDLLSLLQAIRSNDTNRAIKLCRHLLDRGREPLIVLQNLASFYLNLLIAKTAPQNMDMVAVTEVTWQQLCEEANNWDLSEIFRGQQHLKDSEVQIKNTTQPRLWLEVTLLGLLPAAVSSHQSSVISHSLPVTSKGDGETGRRGDGEMGRRGDGEAGRWGDKVDTETRRRGDAETNNKEQITNNQQQITNNQQQILEPGVIHSLYTDGSYFGDINAGGWAVVVYFTDGSVYEMGGFQEDTTNNRMELQAAIAALKYFDASGQIEPVTLYSDSEYVVKGVTQWIDGWKSKNWRNASKKPVINPDLWQTLDRLNCDLVTWQHIKAHKGNPGNERCDYLAKAFANGEQPILNTQVGVAQQTKVTTPKVAAKPQTPPKKPPTEVKKTPTKPPTEPNVPPTESIPPEQLWQQIIANIKFPATQSLLTQHCSLLSFTGNSACITVKSQGLLKFVQEKKAHIETSFAIVCQRKIAISLQVGNSPAPPPETASNNGFHPPEEIQAKNNGKVNFIAQPSAPPESATPVEEFSQPQKEEIATEDSPAATIPLNPDEKSENVTEEENEDDELTHAAQILAESFQGEVIQLTGEFEQYLPTTPQPLTINTMSPAPAPEPEKETPDEEMPF